MQIENIPRWVAASIFKYVDDNRGGVTLFMEIQDKDLTVKDFFELAFDGPHMFQITQSEWDIYVNLSMIVYSKKDQKDLYKMYRLLGTAAKAFGACMPVYKYGEDKCDDQSLIGQLVRKETASHPTEITNYSRVEPTLDLEQGIIAAHYYMCLKE